MRAGIHIIMSTRYRFCIAVCVALALAVAGLGFAWRTHASGVSLQAAQPVQDAYWKSRIATVGGPAAYGEFADAIAQLNPGLQHQEAHIFGGALYEAEGIKGLSACDARFSYGCFHEFMGRAVAALGIGVVGQLNASCRQQFGGDWLACQHGIGHGLIAYLGYDETALNKALGICSSLPYNDPIGGCSGGAFMEYNMKTVLQGEGNANATIRSVDLKDPFTPCDSLPSAYQPSCYFWQAQWWDQIDMQNGEPIDGIFAQLGQRCAALSGTLAERCFQGIGNITAPAANFDGTRSAALCDISSSNSVYQLYCRSFAANSLFEGNGGGTGDAQAVCVGLPGAQYAYCLAYAKNEANILISPEVPSSP
jgi:hypothetical protein